jgi:hypothetical protein
MWRGGGGGGNTGFLVSDAQLFHSSPPHFLYREMGLGETRVRTPNKDGHRSGLHIQMVTSQDSIYRWSRVRTPNKDGHGSGLQIRMVTGQDSIYRWSKVRDNVQYIW